MSEMIVTERTYPIRGFWVLKSALGPFLSSSIFVVLLVVWLLRLGERGGEVKDKDKGTIVVYIWTIAIFTVVRIAIVFLRRATFHYSLEREFLTLRQGILSRQQRHIPYGVIQNVIIQRSILDRMFGLAAVTIENAAQGAGAHSMDRYQRQRQLETVGFSGNRVSIPGLAKDDAETLKSIVLQKMKEHPIEDSQSGL